MSFDPMAGAIDWLDTYRAADLSIVDLYADNAALECGCGGSKTMTGLSALTEYWRQRFAEHPAGELVNLYMDGNAVAVSYRAPREIVLAVLKFNDSGEIIRSRCGPLNPVQPGDSQTGR